MATTTITITNMTCDHCTQAVHEVVGELAGVEAVVADLDSGVVTVSQDGSVSKEAIEEAVVGIGFELA